MLGSETLRKELNHSRITITFVTNANPLAGWVGDCVSPLQSRLVSPLHFTLRSCTGSAPSLETGALGVKSVGLGPLSGSQHVYVTNANRFGPSLLELLGALKEHLEEC